LLENIEFSNHSIPFFEAFREAMPVDGEAADIGFKQQAICSWSRLSDGEVLSRPVLNGLHHVYERAA